MNWWHVLQRECISQQLWWMKENTKRKHLCFHLYNILHNVNIQMMENKSVVAWRQWWRNAGGKLQSSKKNFLGWWIYSSSWLRQYFYGCVHVPTSIKLYTLNIFGVFYSSYIQESSLGKENTVKEWRNMRSYFSNKKSTDLFWI